MGVLSKLKGIFYDEVIVEEPEEEIKKVDKIVKKEVVVEEPVEEVKPKFDAFEEMKEAKEEPVRSERELFRSERTFNFTEFDNEEELPPRKTVLTMEREREREKPTIARSTQPVITPPEPEKPKVFKPSPIISPVYGILDKDYRKEEIKSKTTVNPEPVKPKVTVYDTVRRKAYGTLEDDLEDTLNSMELTIEETRSSMNETDDYSQTMDKAAKIEELINKIDDVADELDKTMSVGELEDSVELENFEDDYNDKTMTDSSLEHDLFNLIDSMYDDKED